MLSVCSTQQPHIILSLCFPIRDEAFPYLNLAIVTFYIFSIRWFASSKLRYNLSILFLLVRSLISHAFIYFCLFLSAYSIVRMVLFKFLMFSLNSAYFPSYSTLFYLMYSFNLTAFSYISCILFSSLDF